MSNPLRALAWIVPLALGACFSGLQSKTPLQQRYLLQPAQTDAAALAATPALPAGSVQVLRPNAAPGLAGDGIALLRPGQRLDYYSNARWAADAPAALQSLVIETLRSAGRFATVESEAGPFAAQYVLSLDLEHFEAVYGADGAPLIQVALVASLGRRSDRAVLVSFTAHAAVPAAADRMQAVIEAFEQATREVLSQVAASVAAPASPSS